VVVLLAADLQDPPDIIPEFVRHWESGYEIVYGVRKVREEGLLLRSVRKVYYRTVSKFSQINIPIDVGEFQLVDRAVVEALRQFDDYYPYIRGMIASCGFKAIGVEYTWKSRKKGFSKNRLFHLIDQGLNGLISFTKVPMRLCLSVGFILSGLSILYGLFMLAIHLLCSGLTAPPGMPTLIVAVFLFSGVQLFFFGILGEYITAIHSQVRHRPLVVERGRLNFDVPADVQRAA
jgi:glycosyltransferase involved in cell wall biosynthesis